MREIVATKAAPEAIGPYSQAVKTGSLVFVSGQLPFVPETMELVEEIQPATRQALENCKAILQAAGTGLDKAVKVTVYLRDMEDFAAMNEVYAEFFPASPPARAAFQVARLPRDAVLEIELVAEIA